MKILPLEQVKIGMQVGQNIYRHDGMLAIPKGATLYQKELDTLRYFYIDFVLVQKKKGQEKEKEKEKEKEAIRTTLHILEATYKHSTLWDKSFGVQLYEKIEKRILKNKRLQRYLNDLRVLDSYSYAQSINISMMVATLLVVNKQVDEELADLVLLSLVHDVGRIQLNDIFNKEGKLTEEEYQELTKHPLISLKMLRKAGFSEYDLKFVSETHERWDGAGYPARIQGDEIDELAQLIFIADVYNALSSYRPYRGIYSPYSVIQIIENERNKMFGEHYVDLFLERFTPYPIGSLVELNNGFTAIVKQMRSHRKLLPIVEIVSEKNGERTSIVDLSIEKDLRIKKIIQYY